MMGRRHVFLLGAVLLTFSILSSSSPALTVDHNVEYQTMDGFGIAVPSWLWDPNNTTQIADMAVNDLGVSIIRVYPEHDFEPVNDNGDPMSLNMSGFSQDGVREQLEVLRKFADAGVDKIILSVFSPPHWMKQNNNCCGTECLAGDPGCTNRLRTDMYDEFTEFYVAYIRAIEQFAGKEVFAISPENEPNWGQWYSSCVYSYTEMRDVTKALHQRFVNEGIDVDIFGAEDLMSNNWGPYYGTCMQDPACKEALDILAVHTYEMDGATASSPSAVKWRRVGDAGAAHGKRVWMTETSGHHDNWSDAMAQANAIHAAVKWGDVAGYVYLTFNTPSGANEDEALVIDGHRKAVYYASKNYYRWIRPGAVRILADDTEDDEVLATAFNHKQNKTLTVVILNTASQTKTVNLTGTDFPSFTVYRSSAGEDCVQVNGAISGATVTLPPSSVTTLYGTGYDMEPVRVRGGGSHTLAGGAAARFDRSGTRVYTIDGRLVTALGEAQLDDNGRVRWVRSGANGRPLSPGAYIVNSPRGAAAAFTTGR
ncbi:MAG: hypothetical protein GF331_20130 [Chitinivibrionales bacterium]|nr:hypothetical protein [Chitinivibrionales bacterium]